MTEAYFVKDRFEKDRLNCHMILAAKTRKGMEDLNFILSEANISGYYFRPRIDLDLLMSLDPKDVFITTACVGGIFKYGLGEAERLIKMIHAKFCGSLMLEVQYHDTDKQKEINEFILSMYRRYGIPIIMGTDSHYINPEDSELRDQRLEANHIKYDDEEGWFMDYPSDDEAYNRFIKQGVLSPEQIKEAMDNTNIFLTFEDISFDKSKKLPTLYPSLTQEERNQKYTELIYKKWDEYKTSVDPSMWPAYEDGIRYEVDTITSTNTSDYFLLDYELVKRAKEKGGMLTYTGRGSAPSYFTNMLLGFTSIDRFAIPVTMYPDRFISKDRLLAGNLPDIDMNCGDVDPFAKAQAEIMGEWRSAPMVAFGTLKRLSAWKMYCRASNVPFEIANAISEQLKKYELDVKHADEDEKDQIDVFEYVEPKYHEQLRMSEKYLGMIDSISPHPCAYLLCQNDIRREIGIYRINSKTGSKKEVYAAFIDGATAESYGYLKNDLLKVDVVKINAEAYQKIGMKQPTVPELLAMTAGDQATWSMYAKGLTMGLNQCEKEKSTEKVQRYKPVNISELSAFVAGIRPAFQSMVASLLDRRHFDYKIPALDKLLQTKEMPSSFILYQEQMMTVLQYASFTAPESYSSIKAIAKKHPEKVLPLKERFLKGFADKLISEGVDRATASQTSDKVWVIISDACGYGFNSCLHGDEVICRDKNSKFTPTIQQMFLIKNNKQYAKQTGHLDLHKKYQHYGYGKAWSMMEDGRLRKNNIIDIRYAGYRPIYRITTESGRTVQATDNHKFPVGRYDNLVMVKDLRVGDRIFCTSGYEKCKERYRFTNGNYPSNTPNAGQRGFQENPNGDSVVYNRERQIHLQREDPCECCKLEFDGTVRYELHHKDGDRTNNAPENYEWLCAKCHKKKHFHEFGRTRKGQKGYPTHEERIISIDVAGYSDVYDVEMEHPYHNFLLSSGIVTGNSHSVAVALDSLYTAYVKAHYPLETYTVLLSNYAEKGDKDRIDLAKIEMKKGFGIRVVPCRFRQDNRGYYIDKENNTISDALMSVKHISKRVADALYAMRNNVYPTFVDLLYDLELHPAFDSRNIEILIRMGYFAEFGSTGKLLNVFNEFRNGKSRFSKNHVEATQLKRLEALRCFEKELPESEISMAETLSFEIEHYGTPITEFPDAKGYFAVIDLDTTYSPKAKLYNVATGTIGTMKIRKPTYNKNPFEIGDVIKMEGWEKKPAYQYVNGKQQAKPGVFVLWIKNYSVMNEK